MLIQYASDIHQEFKDIDIIPKLFKNIKADVLVLAGDICAMADEENFRKFISLIAYHQSKYKYIFHVAGNHEFYSETKEGKTKHEPIDFINRKLKALNKQFPNYLYLNCDVVTVSINNKPYTFIGATLWTKVEKNQWAFAQKSMNDYVHIYVNRASDIRQFTIEDMQKLHAKHRLFLKKAIEQTVGGPPVIVITHHKSISDTPHEKRNEYTQMYESEMRSFFKPHVRVVIWGHTHKHYLNTDGNITYASNPKGYPHQHCGFRNDLGIEV
ncbi:MAG: metallophosphoesterase [Cetobacterium sp.]